MVVPVWEAKEGESIALGAEAAALDAAIRLFASFDEDVDGTLGQQEFHALYAALEQLRQSQMPQRKSHFGGGVTAESSGGSSPAMRRGEATRDWRVAFRRAGTAARPRTLGFRHRALKDQP